MDRRLTHLPPGPDPRPAREPQVAVIALGSNEGDRGDMLAIDHFGASAPADVLLREFGFTVDNVVARAKALLAK